MEKRETGETGMIQGYKLPGLPDGWEAIGIGCDVGDWSVMCDGIRRLPYQVQLACPTAIRIRRIQTACGYRPIENIVEARPFFDEKLRCKEGTALMRIHGIGSTTVGIGFETYTYKQAFDKFVLEDGTPFGMKVL